MPEKSPFLTEVSNEYNVPYETVEELFNTLSIKEFYHEVDKLSKQNS